MAESKSSAAPPPSQSATQEEYDYRTSPLTEHERMIRLVRLLKHTDGSILYDLVPFQLANTPKYDAISYRWGSKELSHSITVGNTLLRVTSNVYDILSDGCLQPQEPEETRNLWIDFLCINQKDKIEKDKQIPLMRHIYTGASQVIIYLGDDSKARRAHEFLALFSQYKEVRFGSSQTMPVFETLFPSRNPVRDKTSLEAFMRREAFLRLITHTYWSRTWIIQEIIRGKQVFILYGGQYADWELFSSVALLLKTDKDLLDMLLENSDQAQSSMVQSAISCIFSILLLKTTLARSSLPLSTILLNTGFSQALLPQDKVIGLLGLSSDADHPDLQPNHKLTVQQVYQKTTSHSLRQGNFALLSIAGLGNRELYRSTIPDLPSWVPDFNSPGLLPSLDHPMWPYRSGGMYTEGNVVTDTKANPPTPTYLKVKSRIIGRIAAMSTLHVQPSDWKDVGLRDMRSTTDWLSPSAVEESIHLTADRLRPESDFHHEIWKMVGTHCQEPYPLPSGVAITRDEALWRTVVKDMLLGSQITYPAPEEIGREYEIFQSVCKALRTGDFVSRVKKLQENTEDWKSYHHVISHMRKSTCPFVVTDGGHMGAVVAGAKVGDLVCIFRGANVPYILRPINENDQAPMQLVCPSYIHGFMDGEVIKCGKYEETWLQIV